MKRISSYISFLILVTIMSFQVIQATHHHDSTFNKTKSEQHSSSQDIEQLHPNCFVCVYSLNQHNHHALLPQFNTVVYFLNHPVLFETPYKAFFTQNYRASRQNRGPPQISLSPIV